MYIIGLTGNIATGKSSVARFLGQLGAHVIDCDVVAHYLMEPETQVWRKIVEAFGRKILHQNAYIDRPKLGRIVFKDPEALRRLEEITHPAVIQETERLLKCISRGYRLWTNKWAESPRRIPTGDLASEPIVVLEAIKLIESGMHRRCDALWVVTCTRQQQIERLITARGLSQGEAEMRIDAQPPVEEKIRLADVVIDNAGTLVHTAQQVREQWGRIQRRLLG